VLAGDSPPIEQATVRILNHSNGERWEAATNARGIYVVEYLSVGGPYRIEVRAVGYRPAARDSILLALGQRLTLDFVLAPAVLELEEVTVVAEAGGLEGARTGPTRIVNDSTIARLPIGGRGYPELALLAPQVTISPNGGLTFAGTHDRLNSIQVDGASNTDLFNSAGSGAGTPGWAVGLNSFTPEAVKEIQVVSAPFDVRYGSFAGGLINAVTKSGGNRVEGSVHGYVEGSDLSGDDEEVVGSYANDELGITVGTPIVRDRLALFVDASLRRQVTPQVFPAPTAESAGDEVGIPYDSLVRFQEALRRYGVEPGSFSAGTVRAPTRNVFGKITLQLGVNSRLELSHNYGHGTLEDETGPRVPDQYALSSYGSHTPETINATRLAWTAGFGGIVNELLVARVDDRRRCRASADFSQVHVFIDSASVTRGEMVAGAADACHGDEIGYTIWELTDNVGVTSGSHRITLGTHDELIDLVDEGRVSIQGQWVFDGLEALEQGTPTGYARDVSGPEEGLAAFHVNQLGVYLQDQWSVTPRLTLTGGIRVEVPFVPTPPGTNPTALDSLGINTSLTPSGHPLWSPRLGVSWDASGRGTTILRGGTGLFAGRPAFQWFRNVYRTNGALGHRIICGDSAVPAFTLDPASQPSACTRPTPPPNSGTFNYFDPDFRFPQSLKVALGVDHLLPGGVVGTIDLLYTGGVHTFHIADANLVGPVTIAAGEDGRILYGTIDPETGEADPSRRTRGVGSAFEIRNGSGDRSWSLTAQLQRQHPDGTEWSVAYTYTDARDRMSPDADLAITNASSTPVDGSLESRAVRTSLWETAHKITLLTTTNLPLGLRLGVVYTGISGAPFTYVLNGDPNADGFSPQEGVSNDLVYVPRDAGDITLAEGESFARLDTLIQRDSCLQRQRGRLVERNSCRNPWGHDIQLRLARRFTLAAGRELEVTADLFNLLNFVNSAWGVSSQIEVGGEGRVVPLLQLTGYDEAHGRGVYRLVPVYRLVDPGTRWRLQLGGALAFH